MWLLCTTSDKLQPIWVVTTRHFLLCPCICGWARRRDTVGTISQNLPSIRLWSWIRQWRPISCDASKSQHSLHSWNSVFHYPFHIPYAELWCKRIRNIMQQAPTTRQHQTGVMMMEFEPFFNSMEGGQEDNSQSSRTFSHITFSLPHEIGFGSWHTCSTFNGFDDNGDTGRWFGSTANNYVIYSILNLSNCQLPTLPILPCIGKSELDLALPKPHFSSVASLWLPVSYQTMPD